MAHGGSATRSPGRFDPAVLGSVLTRLGLGLLVLALPVGAGAGLGLLGEAGSLAVGVRVALAALEGPLLGSSGLPWLFHVAVLALLSGCWLLGAGLVLDGLFD